jgi:hypothetical protein
MPFQNLFPQVGGLVAPGLSGLPAPVPRPRLKGRKYVVRPDRRVVM